MHRVAPFALLTALTLLAGCEESASGFKPGGDGGTPTPDGGAGPVGPASPNPGGTPNPGGQADAGVSEVVDPNPVTGKAMIYLLSGGGDTARPKYEPTMVA